MACIANRASEPSQTSVEPSCRADWYSVYPGWFWRMDVAGRKVNKDRIDPEWREVPDGGHPVSEFLSDAQGAPSPFGAVSFPMSQDSVPYKHPVTKINK